MLRRIINFIVVLAIVIAISGIFIHLYNNSRNESNKFDTVKESVKNDKKNKKNKKDSNNKIENNNKNDKKEDNNNENSKNENLDDNDVVDDSIEQVDNKSNDDASNVNGSEVAVASTGKSKNIYISIFGGLIVLTGTGMVLLKLNKGRI